MEKYNYELKKRIATEYLSEEGGTSFLANKYGICCRFSRCAWLALTYDYVAQ